MADRVGQQLGNYRLMRLIGQGGFGEVYLGEHVYLRTQAAIKVLQVRLANEDTEGFLNEARTIASLKHPHIVRVLDFGIDTGTPFLVMDYAPYGTLRQRYPKGTRLPPAAIVSYVKQVAAALQYAHDRKLVHRDVKPENMLLDENNEVLLSDFGIALVTQSSRYQSTKEVVGTVAYMAPEQLQGKPRPASDQYALGIVVYEWVCGDRPFHGSFVELYSQHSFVPPPPLREKDPAILPDVEQVVMTALAKDPLQRFASVQAFAKALEEAYTPAQLRAMPMSARPVEPTLPAAPAPGLSVYMPDITRPTSDKPLPTRMTTQPNAPQSVKRGLSRRTVVAGLVGVAAAGGGLTWLVRSLSSSPTAKSGSTATPTPTNPPLGTTLYTYSGHSSKIRVLAWSPDGRRIASGSDDYTAQVWDAATGGDAVIYRGHSSYVEGVAWSPDSKRIASGSADGTVQIWDRTTGDLIYTYRGHRQWVNRISWSPNGKYIASGEQSGVVGRTVTVRVWEVATGNTIVIYQGHTDGVFALAWSPDGTRIASDGYDGTLQIWESTTGNRIGAYRGNAFLFGLSWSPDSKHVAFGGGDPPVRVLDANTGKVVYTYNGHSQGVGDVAWSPDGTRIAAGSSDQTVHLFNAANGTKIYIYQRQFGHIDALAWSPDSKLIASGSDDSSVQVWQAE